MPGRLSFLVFLLVSAGFSQSIAPLPSDPLELATGPAKVLDTPKLRGTVLGLIEQARQNNGMHTAGTAPFEMKVSFTSSGSSRFDGAGTVEETWMSQRVWRWSAHLGDYSIDRIGYRGFAYDQPPSHPMPLRLRMVRAAVFWPVNGNFAPAYLRVATAKWDGDEVLCVLRSRGPTDEEFEGSADVDTINNLGRRWSEREYCIDAKTGLLRIYSEAPGVYVVYDYNDVTIHFHGRTLARQITVVEGGTAVLKIRIDGIDDPHVGENFFAPSPEALAAGPREVASGVVHFSLRAAASGREVQPVVVIATINAKGKVEDAEAPPGADASLTDAALSLVKKLTYAHTTEGVPHQRLAYINVNFSPPTEARQ